MTYVTNKRRGGDSGQKGVRFEDFFAAHRLAEELSHSITTPMAVLPTLELQAEAIVDDLVVSWGQSQVNFYQCKNVATVNWTTGTHPLAEDFHAQHTLSVAQNFNGIRTSLVVPTEALRVSLRASIPSEIADHTDVIAFPYLDGKLNRIVLESDAVRNSLREMARVDDPTDDALADVYGALIHGVQHGQVRNCLNLLQMAQSLSPHLVRLLPSQLKGFSMEPGFEDVLAKVPGLRYRLSRGFFCWEGLGTSGVFSQNCLSSEFERFQRRVVNQAPTTFEAFEELL